MEICTQIIVGTCTVPDNIEMDINATTQLQLGAYTLTDPEYFTTEELPSAEGTAFGSSSCNMSSIFR